MARGAFDLDFPLLTITHILSFANATPSSEEQAACLQRQPLPSVAQRGSLTGKPVRVKGKSRRCEWETASRGEARTVVGCPATTRGLPLSLPHLSLLRSGVAKRSCLPPPPVGGWRQSASAGGVRERQRVYGATKVRASESSENVRGTAQRKQTSRASDSIQSIRSQ